jgi:hypothetical protein
MVSTGKEELCLREAVGILVLGAKLVNSNAEMRTQLQHQEFSGYQNIRTGRGAL